MSACRVYRRAALGSLQRLASGSQGTVYATQGIRIGGRVRGLYKEYLPPVREVVDAETLREAAAFPFGLSTEQGELLLSVAAWPVATVVDGGGTDTTTGFLMPEVDGRFSVTLRLPSGRTRTGLAQFQHLLNPDGFTAEMGLVADDGVRLRLLEEVARALEVLHGHGIAVGDMSPRNLLFALQPAPAACFVDCDAMVLRGRSVLPQLETPDWDVAGTGTGEPPGTTASDAYKFGLLVLRTLARDQGTRSADLLPHWARRPLRGILELALSPDPASRPDARVWGDCLGRLASSVDEAGLSGLARDGGSGGSRPYSLPAREGPAGRPVVPAGRPYAAPGGGSERRGTTYQVRPYAPPR